MRKLAKDLGVDLSTVDPTGRRRHVTRADVERAAKLTGLAPSARPAYAGASRTVAPERAGPREERIPVQGVLKTMAEAMVRSAFTAPHVTEWVEVDVTRRSSSSSGCGRAPSSRA